MPGILKIKITLAVLAAFLSAVAIAATMSATSAGAGASVLRAARADAYAPMSLFRC
ncbi:MAG TPA: hypothetical protein VMU95_01175 [Trebonia sp.]|nr:hypothetical protein [Trebonia sp.]